MERSKRGKRGKAQSGFVIVGARPPYGYRVVSEPHKTWLEIDPEEAEIVELVFRLYLYGDGQSGPMAMGAIAVRLTEMRVPTRGDKQKHFAKKQGIYTWQRAMIQHILANETYTGIWHYGKTKMVTTEEARKVKPKRSPRKEKKDKSTSKVGLGEQVRRQRDDWVAVKVPAIIDPKVFEMAKKRRELNAEQAKRHVKRQYLLAALKNTLRV